MNSEKLSLLKLLLTEAFVEEVISDPDRESPSSISAIVLAKLKTLSHLGLSKFWSAERLLYYRDEDVESAIGLGDVRVLGAILSTHARFTGKMALCGLDAKREIMDYMQAVIDASIRVEDAATISTSLIGRESLYFFAVSTDLFKTAKSRQGVIENNTWLGMLHMALATGILPDIFNSRLKGK